MLQKEKNKLCWNCEARVGIEATYCPFCGTDLLQAEAKKQEAESTLFVEQTLEESLASLYTPPYSARNQQGLGVPDEREEVVYKEPVYQDTIDEPMSAQTEEKGKGFFPLMLLSVAMTLGMLGFLLLFFSEGGSLTLQWNSRYWFVYCLLAIPLFMVGFKALRDVDH